MITGNDLRQKYLEFFRSKGHAVVPSASLIPENDPTALFINSGMHPLVPYLMGEKHPKGKRIVDVQKCIRTIDIDEVGDNRHMTFFEMMGNWSLGDYFKKEAIEWSWEFLTSQKWLGLDPKRIYVTVFAGDENSPRDDESIDYWKRQFEQVGIEAGVCELGQEAQKNSRIFLMGAEDNWWGPAGETGPCGPDTEMFYDTSPEKGSLRGTFENCIDTHRVMELWNDVFMQYEKKLKVEDKNSKLDSEKQEYEYVKLEQQNVDTGMGLERTLAILQGVSNAFDTEFFVPLFSKIEKLCDKKYSDNEEVRVAMRIIADHIKASMFIVADGVEPSNSEQGYVLRRLIRRAVVQAHRLGIESNVCEEIGRVVMKIYREAYPEILDEKNLAIICSEEEKFKQTLARGLRQFEKIVNIEYSTDKMILGRDAFDLFQTYGFPLEIIQEEAEQRGFEVDEKGFQRELQKHQELSRTASAGMFKGGLADTKEKTKQLHTAAHLMLAGLRNVLGDHIHQKGSNINGERVRFDFSHAEKMTEEEKKKVEEFVNEAIEAKVPVVVEEMSLDEAKKTGAEGAFESRYGDRVKVYSVEGYSKEICGGPHVENTGDISGKFRITKEQSSSAGVRRVKAVLE